MSIFKGYIYIFHFWFSFFSVEVLEISIVWVQQVQISKSWQLQQWHTNVQSGQKQMMQMPMMKIGDLLLLSRWVYKDNSVDNTLDWKTKISVSVQTEMSTPVNSKFMDTANVDNIWHIRKLIVPNSTANVIFVITSDSKVNSVFKVFKRFLSHWCSVWVRGWATWALAEQVSKKVHKEVACVESKF